LIELVVTTGPRDATTRTREALRSGVERIVAIGGDGTVNEVVNGFFDHGVIVNPDAELAIIEAGTGGDLRKTLGIPSDSEAAVERILAGTRRRVDVGRVRMIRSDGAPAERLFINVSSFGLSGSTVRRVDGNPRFKRLAGGLAYVTAAAAEAMLYAPNPVRLSFDGGPSESLDLFACAVCNARYFGGGLHIAPMAEPDDGWLDVILIRTARKHELLATIPALFTGRHLEKPWVRHARVRTLRVEIAPAGPGVFVETDGESAGQLAATFDLLPRALAFRC
jgi:YegS/Rv2252/BmrU family lipid kinase